MYYPTRHCTPLSSTSFVIVFYAVCCSSTGFTIKSTSTLMLVFPFCVLQSTCSNMLHCKACVQSLQRTVHFSPVLYVKLLELEFVFGFFRHKRVSKGLRSQLRKAEVSQLFIDISCFVPGFLMVLVIAELI